MVKKFETNRDLMQVKTPRDLNHFHDADLSCRIPACKSVPFNCGDEKLCVNHHRMVPRFLKHKLMLIKSGQARRDLIAQIVKEVQALCDSPHPGNTGS